LLLDNQEASAKEAYSSLIFETTYGDDYDLWAASYVATEKTSFQKFLDKLIHVQDEDGVDVPSMDEWKELENISFDINDYTFTDISQASDPVSITTKNEVTNNSGDLVGYIFQAYATNGYGDMTIVFLVGSDGTILNATFQALNQTLNLDRTISNLELYIDTNISDMTPSGDLQSGATYSKNTMQQLIEDVASAFVTIDDLNLNVFDSNIDLMVNTTYLNIFINPQLAVLKGVVISI